MPLGFCVLLHTGVLAQLSWRGSQPSFDSRSWATLMASSWASSTFSIIRMARTQVMASPFCSGHQGVSREALLL